MKTLLFTIQTYIGRLLFPSSCAGCNIPGPAICSTCLSSIRPSDSTEHEGIFGLYDYGNPIVSHAVWNLKYQRRGQEMKLLISKGVPILGEILSEELQSIHLEVLTIVPIPQYKTKTRSRGFNQSTLIATWIHTELPHSRVEALLEKSVETIPQSHLSDKKARMKNSAGTMRTRQHLNKKNIYIVVDDVTTTGATFLEARRALKEGGAKHIICIAVAHGYKRR